MTTFAYVRVSTKEQHEDRQLIAVREAGVIDKNIFVDKQSGKDFNRPAYKRLIKNSSRPTLSLLRVSTGLVVIIPILSNNGGLSPKTSASSLRFSTCPFYLKLTMI